MRAPFRWRSWRRAVVAAGFVALALAACAPLPTRGLRAPRADLLEAARIPAPVPSTTGFTAANATAAQRAETVDRIWKTIDRLRYDPTFSGGADVPALRAAAVAAVADSRVADDAAFYRVLKASVRALHDSHTLVLTPREAEDARTFRATQIGIVFAVAEGRMVVGRVVPGFPADVAGSGQAC